MIDKNKLNSAISTLREYCDEFSDCSKCLFILMTRPVVISIIYRQPTGMTCRSRTQHLTIKLPSSARRLVIA